MKNYILAPSILASDLSNLKDTCKILEEGKVDLIHIDIMDGQFVPNITVGPFFIETIKKLTKIPLDVHLMIKNPENFYKKFIEKGASWVIIHYEAVLHHDSILKDIRKNGAKNGIAINPSTSVESLSEIFPYLDMVLVMGVNPGFSGQEIIPETMNKVSKLKKLREKMKYKFKIAFDGGVNFKSAKILLQKGCDILMVGSGIFYSKDIFSEIKKFKELEVK